MPICTTNTRRCASLPSAAREWVMAGPKDGTVADLDGDWLCPDPTPSFRPATGRVHSRGEAARRATQASISATRHATARRLSRMRAGKAGSSRARRQSVDLDTPSRRATAAGRSSIGSGSELCAAILRLHMRHADHPKQGGDNPTARAPLTPICRYRDPAPTRPKSVLRGVRQVLIQGV